jgi:hypothetical protein
VVNTGVVACMCAQLFHAFWSQEEIFCSYKSPMYFFISQSWHSHVRVVHDCIEFLPTCCSHVHCVHCIRSAEKVQVEIGSEGNSIHATPRHHRFFTSCTSPWFPHLPQNHRTKKALKMLNKLDFVLTVKYRYQYLALTVCQVKKCVFPDD